MVFILGILLSIFLFYYLSMYIINYVDENYIRIRKNKHINNHYTFIKKNNILNYCKKCGGEMILTGMGTNGGEFDCKYC